MDRSGERAVARSKEALLRRFTKLAHGIPRHDAFASLLAMRRFPDDQLHDEYGLTRPGPASSSRYAAPAPSTNRRE